MNLPEFGSVFSKGCKVFAVTAALVACAACGGGNTEDTGNTQVNSEVEISSQENPSEGAASQENSENAESAEGAENGAAAENSGETGSENVADGSSEPAEVAQAPAGNEQPPEVKAAVKKPETPARNLTSLRDPFVQMTVGNDAASMAEAKARLATASAAERAAFQKNQESIKPKVAQPKKPVVKIVKPAIAVNGILMDGSGRPRAMINDGNQTVEVGVGDKVSKYHIFAINAQTKTVTIGLDKQHKWDYTLKQELFGSAKAH
jgi:hypothetical protein